MKNFRLIIAAVCAVSFSAAGYAAPTPASQNAAISALLKTDAKTLRQREAYQAAVAAIRRGDSAGARVLQQTVLKGYPLNVWLDYYQLATYPDSSKFRSVIEFIEQGRHQELADLLRSKYVEYFAGVGNYKAISRLLPELPYGGEARLKREQGQVCRFYEARWRLGSGSGAAVAHAASIYNSTQKTPEACYGLLAYWSQQGYKTDKTVLKKFEKVYLSRKTESVTRSLAAELERSPFAPIVRKSMAMYADPEKVMNLVPDGTDTTRRAAVLIFKRLANLSAHTAAAQLAKFERTMNPTLAEKIDIYTVLADSLMSHDCTVDDVKWADTHLPAFAWNDALREKRLRRAIWFAQWPVVYGMTGALPQASAKEINWRYWRAYSALKTGHQDEGRKLMNEVSADRSFFGFLAAQQLGLKVNFNQQNLTAGVSIDTIKRHEAVSRFMELYAMDDANAMVEWKEVSKNTAEDVALQMADWALSSGNVKYAIQNVIAGKRWDALSYRFPAPYMDLYKRYSASMNVPLTFLYGVSRQESMMDPKIKSPVGAVGLMQLMPETARTLSRKNQWPYSGVADLTDPDKNIRLGSKYLRDMLDKFDNNRVLAAVAYNAGPQRVYRWSSKDGMKRDTAMYVENIPFDETRKYVQNVLLYDVIYNKLLNGKTAELLHKHELAYRY